MCFDWEDTRRLNNEGRSASRFFPKFASEDLLFVAA